MPDAQVTHDSANARKYTCGNPLYRWHIQTFMGRLGERVSQTDPRTVLDAGCGEGYVLNYLGGLNSDWSLTGVDLSEGAIDFAVQHFGSRARFQQGSILKLPFSDHSFDTVICSEVLEHLDRPEEAIAELKRVSRRYVILTVPLEPWFKILNDAARTLGISPDPGHVNFWTRRDFPEFVGRHFADARCETCHIYNMAVCKV